MRKYIVSVLSLLAILGSLISPCPVKADTVNLTVEGEGLPTSGTYFGGTLDYQNLQSDDDDTSGISIPPQSGPTYYRHSYNSTNFAAAGTITSVTQYFKVSAAAGNPLGTIANPFCRDTTTANNYYATEGYNPGGGLNYVTFSHVWATNPATGSAWTLAEVNATTFGLRNRSGSALRWTYMYLMVTYTPPTVPTCETDAATNNSYNGLTYNVTLNGDVTDDGGDDIDCRGFAWGTTSNATTPGSGETPPATTYTSNWTECTSDWGTGTFSHVETTFAGCTTYYYRAYAHNSQGWDWGDEVSFTTLCSPAINTLDATNVSTTTARLNAVVLTDGGQAADVRFSYGTVSGSCTFNATCDGLTCNATTYNTTTAWVVDTYTTGNTPYVDISGLTAGTTYYVCAQIRNDVACTCGGEETFTTESTLAAPTVFKGIAFPEQISLFWIKGDGADKTLIRYKTGSYPINTADGSQVYFDTSSSYVHTGLTRGTTYYYRAWSESGGAYSTGNVTLMLTTLAFYPGGDPQPTPSTPDTWLQAPDYTRMSAFPGYEIVNWWAESFEIPYATFWFLCASSVAITAGIFAYWKSQKILIGDMVVVIMIGLFAMMELMPLWIVMPFLIVAFVAIAVGERI